MLWPLLAMVIWLPAITTRSRALMMCWQLVIKAIVMMATIMMVGTIMKSATGSPPTTGSIMMTTMAGVVITTVACSEDRRRWTALV